VQLQGLQLYYQLLERRQLLLLMRLSGGWGGANLVLPGTNGPWEGWGLTDVLRLFPLYFYGFRCGTLTGSGALGCRKQGLLATVVVTLDRLAQKIMLQDEAVTPIRLGVEPG